MSNRDIFAELVEGFESLAAEREGEKKHYWLVAYISYNEYGGSVYGHVTLRTGTNYFNIDSMKEAQQHISKGSAFLSVSYLGEMTEEEFKGEE